MYLLYAPQSLISSLDSHLLTEYLGKILGTLKYYIYKSNWMDDLLLSISLQHAEKNQ